MNRTSGDILPADKTLRIPTILCEPGWGPAPALLELIQAWLVVRIAAADPDHSPFYRSNPKKFKEIRIATYAFDRIYNLLEWLTSSPSCLPIEQEFIKQKIGLVEEWMYLRLICFKGDCQLFKFNSHFGWLAGKFWLSMCRISSFSRQKINSWKIPAGNFSFEIWCWDMMQKLFGPCPDYGLQTHTFVNNPTKLRSLGWNEVR